MNDSSNQPPLRMLVYTSSTDHGWSDAELVGLVRQAQHCNLALGITGRLVCLERRFVQVLEGPGQTAMDLYRRIRLDPRHAEVTLLHEAAILERAYTGWSMDLVHGRDLPQAETEALLARVVREQNQRAGNWPAVLKGIRDLDSSISHIGPRVLPQQGRAYATVERLVESARALVLRDGLAATTIPSIATQANVSLNTAYRYFASTDQVFSAMVRRWQTRRLEAFALRLEERTFACVEEIAREISTHISETYFANDLVPVKIREVALRTYHHIAYDALWNLADMIVQTMRRNGLPSDDPALRARIAMALAGLGAQAKMAALYAPGELRTPECRSGMSTILVAAMRVIGPNSGAAPQ